MTERCGGLKKGPSYSSKNGAVLLVPDQHLLSVATAALAVTVHGCSTALIEFVVTKNPAVAPLVTPV